MTRRAKNFVPDPVEMLSIYLPGKGGRSTRCVGFILPRRYDFEAFDADTKSIGIFPTMKRAADAISVAVLEVPR
jgi:hypothetical protein